MIIVKTNCLNRGLRIAITRESKLFQIYARVFYVKTITDKYFDSPN